MIKIKATSGSYHAGKRSVLVFKLITLLLPLLLLGLLEGALRLGGYGQDYRLFVEDEKRKGYLVMNPHASEKYFTEAENATVGNYEPFRKHKDQSIFRIFVLGESTTVGYPYLHNGSFHRWLQYRLTRTFPGKHFEIINLSLTAVNTYTVLGFAEELVDYQPDAVLIYTGHNEYYGALGVGSTSSIGRNPALIRLALNLREYRLVQLFNRMATGLRKWSAGRGADTRENLMKRMAAGQQIAYQSDIYTKGIEQFEENLDRILGVLTKRGVPVFVSNLVSNEKDLKPFISDTSRTEVSAIDHFREAEKAWQQGNFALARQLYQKAKELDLLRFRAPEALNDLIKKAAARYPNVHYVDTKSVFEAHSPHGIIGRETLLEHVHPNLFGYALLSDAFYGAIKRAKLISFSGGQEMSLPRLLREMPVTKVDSLKGAYEIMMLKEGWPFNEPAPADAAGKKTFEEKLAGGLAIRQYSWGEAMVQLWHYYLKEKKHPEALRVAEALSLEYPHDPVYYNQAGKLALHMGDRERAIFYLKKAFNAAADFDTAKGLFVTLLQSDRPEEALPYINYAAAHNPSTFQLSELRVLVDKIIELKGQYSRDSTNAGLANHIAAVYLQFANTAAAAKYVEKSLRVSGNNPEALQLKERIQLIKN